MIRLSANLGFLWPDRPLLARIVAAGRAGFEAVEVHWPYNTEAETVAKACAQVGVRLIGLNTVPGDMAKGEFGLAALPGREAAFAAAFDQALAYAEGAGASMIHAMAGVAREDDAAARAAFLANLDRAAEQAEPAGVTVLIEPINAYDRPGYFLRTAFQAEAIIRELGRPNLKLMFDAYHVGMEGEDPFALFPRLLPVIGHVQVAAVPSRAEPDEGRVDFCALFRLIEESGYSGFVGAEYRPRGDTDAGLGWRTTASGRASGGEGSDDG